MHPATNNLCDHVAIVRFGRLALIPSRLQRKSGFRPSRRYARNAAFVTNGPQRTLVQFAAKVGCEPFVSYFALSRVALSVLKIESFHIDLTKEGTVQ